MTLFFFQISHSSGKEIGEKLAENKWMAVRVIITLVGISRDTVYFNNNIKLTSAHLNATSVTQVNMILQNVLRHSNFDGIFKTCLVGFTEIDSNLCVFTGISQISAVDTESTETINIAFQDKFYGGKVIDECRVMPPKTRYEEFR